MSYSTNSNEATEAPAGIAVRIAQVSAEQGWADPTALERNAAKVAEWYEDAADDVDLIVFPEVVLTGYIPLKGYDQKRKRILAEIASRACEVELPKLAQLTAGRRAIMVVGFMESSTMRNEIYNSVALIEDGRIAGVYRKMHLPVEENHYFVPGDEVVVVPTRIGRVALSICYDMVFPETARMAALHGADIMCVSSNWLAINHLERLGEVLPVARAIEEQMHVVFVNGVGELEVRGHRWSLYGQSSIVSSSGEVLARAGKDEQPLDAVLPTADATLASDVFPLLRDRRPHLYGDLVLGGTQFAALRELS